MADTGYESTSSKTTAVFTPTGGDAITFCYTDVTMQEFVLDAKLDISTNCDSLSGDTVGPKTFVPAGLYEIGNFSMTCPNDLGRIDDLRVVLGQAGMATLYAAAHSLRLGKYASDHDIKIAHKIAYVLCGGDLSEETLVSEQYLLDIEREAFLSLTTERKTLERIQHMLTKGKPLRN